MHAMKRVQLVLLFLVVAALLAGTRADAATWLTPTDPESGASGQARKVGKLVSAGREFDCIVGVWWWIYNGTLEVKSSGLAPNAAYTVRWESGINTRSGEFSLTTDAFGDGAAVGGVNVCKRSKSGAGEVYVTVFDANGAVVLFGTIPF
jgi:hypothetical protein